MEHLPFFPLISKPWELIRHRKCKNPKCNNNMLAKRESSKFCCNACRTHFHRLRKKHLKFMAELDAMLTALERFTTVSKMNRKLQQEKVQKPSDPKRAITP